MAKTPTNNAGNGNNEPLKPTTALPGGGPEQAGTTNPGADDGEGAIRAEDNTPAGPQPDGTAEAAPAGTDPSTEEKITVETTGDFMLHDPYTLDTIEASGQSTVRRSAFIDARLQSGDLKQVGGKKQKAADE